MSLAAPFLFGVMFAVSPYTRYQEAESTSERRAARKAIRRDSKNLVRDRFLFGMACGATFPTGLVAAWIGCRLLKMPFPPTATGNLGRNDQRGSGKKSS